MTRVSAKDLKRLLESTRLLHSHGQGSFHQRLHEAVVQLFPGTYHTLEALDPVQGTHAVESNSLPYWQKREAELQQRATELFPVDHPLFPLMMAGHLEPTRLSDLTSDRQFRQTDFFHDIFKPMDVSRQIAMPFVLGNLICGMTIARGGRDYSDREFALARLFSRHLATAYASDRVLTSAETSAERSSRFDHAYLRQRGLTRRECEVLWWVAEGKQNFEISIILGIARRTVEFHLTSVFSKLGVENRTAAVANAFPGGLN